MSRVYSQRKVEYFERLKALFAKYDKCFVVSADFVGSNQMQMIRMALRGTGVVVFGKNTMMRAVLKQYSEENPADQITKLLDTLKGNVGLVFTDNSDLVHVRNILVENVVPAPAKAGVFAPVAVTVPAGPTGMEPGMTSFFQALNIATQIKRGAIEIINDVPLLQGSTSTGRHIEAPGRRQGRARSCCPPSEAQHYALLVRSGGAVGLR